MTIKIEELSSWKEEAFKAIYSNPLIEAGTSLEHLQKMPAKPLLEELLHGRSPHFLHSLG